MGNTSAKSHLKNQSKRNVRVFFSDAALEINAFIVANPESIDMASLSPQLPGGKTFSFRKDLNCVRVLASQSQYLPWEEKQFVSVFEEDEEDENVCSKQIIQSMALPSPITVILYDI